MFINDNNKEINVLPPRLLISRYNKNKYNTNINNKNKYKNLSENIKNKKKLIRLT